MSATPPQFTLWQLLYGMTVVAALISVFGWEATTLIGIVFVVIILLVLSVQLAERVKDGGRTPWLQPRDVLFSLGCVVVLAMFCSPFIFWSHTFLRSGRCWSNHKVISLALSNYHDRFRCLPPAYVSDANGKPMYSWRVLLLPYLNEHALFAQYRLNESWDSPHNRQLLESTPMIYYCRGDKQNTQRETPPGHTNYLAITGPETAFENSEPFAGALDELPAVIVTEVPHYTVPWTSPTDISAADYLARHTPPRCCWSHSLTSNFFYEKPGGCYVADARADRQFLLATVSPEQRRKLITRNGTSYHDLLELRDVDAPDGYWKWGNIARLIALLLLIFVPIFHGRYWRAKSEEKEV